MIKLSVCIATLNRAAFIGETLDGILEQMTPEVEVVVVDGASTDGTDKVVEGRFAGRDRCRYRRLEKKGGVDQDYCIAVEEAAGEYCWLMSDDDLLVPGAVARVLAELAGAPDLVVVNAEVAKKDFSAILVDSKLPENLPERTTLTPDRQDELLATCGDLLTFIGAVVISRSLWLARDKPTYFGTEFIHVGVIFQKPLERAAVIVRTPLVRIRYGNAQWSARAFDIWMIKWPALVWSFPHLSDEAKRRVCPREPWRSTRRLTMMKSRGNYSLATYRASLAQRPMSLAMRLKVIALAAFPNVLWNALISLFVAPLMTWDKNVHYELSLSPYYYRTRWFGRPAAKT